VNASTTRPPTTADPRADRGSCAPFAALPHDIAADPHLSPTDVRVVAALLFYARSKASCWPSDRSIGLRVGRSVRTVQRALGRLQTLGLVERSPDPGNPTGRLLTLRHRCRTPTTPAAEPPASPVSYKGKRERERERPESAAGPSSPPPPAGHEGGQEPDLATLHQWAEGSDRILRRVAERRLAELAAGDVTAVESVTPPPDHAPSSLVAVEVPSPPVAPEPTGSTRRTVARAYSQGLPRHGNAQA
jgi:hypothetical protein